VRDSLLWVTRDKAGRRGKEGWWSLFSGAQHSAGGI